MLINKLFKNYFAFITFIIFATIELLSVGCHKSIPTYMRSHKLSGNYQNYWECHIKPDLLLIWKQEEKPEKFIILTRLGSHSDLF